VSSVAPVPSAAPPSAAALRDGVLTIPVIDISSFRMPYADDAARAQVVQRVDEAARTVGFMQITGHGIPACVVEELTDAIDACGAPDRAEVVPDAEDAVTAWFHAAGTVARTMMKIFGVALDGDFGSCGDHSADVVRISNGRMPGLEAETGPGQPGMAPHTDRGVVTVLWSDRVPGLEILGVDGAWHPVLPAGRALIVNLGDALARWTNGRWVSTMHRVVPARADGELVPRRSAAYCHDWPVA